LFLLLLFIGIFATDLLQGRAKPQKEIAKKIAEIEVECVWG
jgi:hypothetical protein